MAFSGVPATFSQEALVDPCATAPVRTCAFGASTLSVSTLRKGRFHLHFKFEAYIELPRPAGSDLAQYIITLDLPSQFEAQSAIVALSYVIQDLSVA